MVLCVARQTDSETRGREEKGDRITADALLCVKKDRRPGKRAGGFRDSDSGTPKVVPEGVPAFEPTITSSPPEEARKEATAAATTGGFARTHLVHDRLEVLDKLDLTIAVVVHRFEHRLHLLGRQHVA